MTSPAGIDNNLLYLPDAIKRLNAWIGEREWNGEKVADNYYQQIKAWQDMVKAGKLYEPSF